MSTLFLIMFLFSIVKSEFLSKNFLENQTEDTHKDLGRPGKFIKKIVTYGVTDDFYRISGIKVINEFGTSYMIGKTSSYVKTAGTDSCFLQIEFKEYNSQIKYLKVKDYKGVETHLGFPEEQFDNKFGTNKCITVIRAAYDGSRISRLLGYYDSYPIFRH